MDEHIELKVRVARRMRYIPESSWGAFALEALTNRESVQLNDWGNFVVTGNVQELLEGQDYEIEIKPTSHPKYGDGYTFVKVKPKEIKTVEDQYAYLRAMVKESYYNAIIEKYPKHNIIQMMKDDTFDYKDIKGIGSKVYAKIKNFLLSNLEIQEALVSLQDLNISFKAMKKLINHFGSASIVVQKVQDNIYTLVKAEGFGFLKVDAYALNRGDSKTNRNRIVSALEYILEQEEQSGHSWISYNTILSEAKDLLLIDEGYIDEVINEEQEKYNSIFIVKNDRVGLRKNYILEKRIKHHLYRLLNAKNEFTIEDIDKKIAEYEAYKGFTFTDEQKNAIRLAIQYNVLILNGKAGTGKTFTLQGILGVIDGIRYVCCALSGKASKVMNALGLNAMTIHRALGVNPKGGFNYHESNKMPHELIVMDESGMNNIYITHSVVSAIRDGSKLIMVGDNGQLSSIGCGAVFHDLLESKKLPMQELTIIQRQGQKSGILLAANKVREGIQLTGKEDYEKKVFGELKDFHLIPVQNKQFIKQMVLDICKNYKGRDITEFQVLTGLKTNGDLSSKNLNIELQKIFNDINKPFVTRGGYDYREGDKVIQSGNNYEAPTSLSDYFKDADLDWDEEETRDSVSVFNGTLGQITQITEHKGKKFVFINFDGVEQEICYSQDLLDQIELAYAITTHRAQGSTIQHVLFAFDYSSYMLLSKQLVYTMITRASKGCVGIVENRALHHAIRTDHAGKRQTWLYDMMMDTENDYEQEFEINI